MFRSSWTPNTGQSSSSVYFLPVVFHAGTILCNCTVVFHAGTILYATVLLYCSFSVPPSALGPHF